MPLTFTYSADMTSQLQRLRFLLGDTDVDAVILYDQEYGAVLTGGAFAQSNDYLAAALMAEAAKPKIARMASSLTAGGTSVVWADRFKAFDALPGRLRLMAARNAPVGPYIGGVSRSEIASVESNTDRVTPAFTRRTGDDPAGSPGFSDRVWGAS